MATKRDTDSTTLAELMRTMIIIQLGLAKIPQANIRSIVGGDINHINKIVKQLKPKNSG